MSGNFKWSGPWHPCHETRGKQSADSSHVNYGDTNTHLPLVAITVNSDERPVYALLDSGSTNTFISV